MKTIIIYFDESKKNKQVIQPRDEFWKAPNVSQLVQHITHSDLEGNIKNYHSIDII